MKIVIFTDAFIPQYNGIVTTTISLVKGLADKGHKIYIIAPKYKNFKEFEYSNVKVIRVISIPAGFYPDFKLTNFFSPNIFRFLKKEKVDIIHFQTPLTLGIQAVILSKVLKVPLVGTYHTFIADEQYLKHIKLDYKKVKELAWKYSKLYYNRCDLITCPTEIAKKELLKNSFNEPIKAISNGIDPKIFDNSKSKQIKNKYNPNGNLLLFVGRIAHEKNVLYLLRCFKLIVRKMPETKLFLIGDGPQMKEVKRKIKQLDLSKNIILTGRIDHDKLAKSGIFGACDLFITASTTETQGITMLEAQANGIVSLGIDEGGTKDLIKNNYNGFLIENNNKEDFVDKVVLLLKDKKLYRKMKKNTLKEIKKHNMRNVIDIWEEEYKQLIYK